MRSRLVAVLLLSVLTAGCGLTRPLTDSQVVGTQSFGAATESVGRFGEEEFVGIRARIVAMNRELIALDNTKTSSSLVLDHPTSAEATATRVAASKALRLYGELLVQLVTSDDAASLQTAAASFLENTTTALNRDLTDPQRSALTQLIAGVGSLYLESRKAEALKAIVPAYEAPVDELAQRLMEDFSLEPGASGYLKALEVTARRLENAAVRIVDAGDRYASRDRDRATDAYALAESALTEANALGARAARAIAGLQQANHALVKVIEDEHYGTDDIRAYAREIRELVNLYQVLSR